MSFFFFKFALTRNLTNKAKFKLRCKYQRFHAIPIGHFDVIKNVHSGKQTFGQQMCPILITFLIHKKKRDAQNGISQHMRQKNKASKKMLQKMFTILLIK